MKFFILFLPFIFCLYAQDQLSLVALLIKDGQFDRAQSVLFGIKPKEKQKKYHAKYLLLRGAIFLHQDKYKKALVDFKKSISLGGDADLNHLYMSQTYYYLNRANLCIRSLDALGSAFDDNLNKHLLKADCNWKKKKYSMAWNILEHAWLKFENFNIYKKFVFYLSYLGLFEQAFEYYLKIVSRSDVSPRDLLEVASLFEKSRYYTYSLELAKLRFDDDQDVNLALAGIYFKNKDIYSAAEILAKASIKNSNLRLNAAELLKRSNQYFRALYINSLLLDEKEKLKQRLSIYLYRKEYEKIVSMQSEFLRKGLLDSDSILYAFAFANFRIGKFQQARELVFRVQDESLFKKALALRTLIQKCQTLEVVCYEKI